MISWCLHSWHNTAQKNKNRIQYRSSSLHCKQWCVLLEISTEMIVSVHSVLISESSCTKTNGCSLQTLGNANLLLKQPLCCSSKQWWRRTIRFIQVINLKYNSDCTVPLAAQNSSECSQKLLIIFQACCHPSLNQPTSGMRKCSKGYLTGHFMFWWKKKNHQNIVVVTNILSF